MSYVMIAGYDMQSSAPVYMRNRKGRKHAQKMSRLLRKIIRRLEEPEHEYP